MPSSTEMRVRTLAAALVLVTLAFGARAAAQPATTRADAPTDADVARALERVRADPNLTPDRTIKTLRWKRSDDVTASSSRLPGWIMWFVDLFRWIDRSARVLVWVTVAGLALMLGVYIVRLIGTPTTLAGLSGSFVPPTHVRDLDIRPESLPAEIGAAARALWDRGEHRAALALLYRGMLSRLAHVHQVPIRDSSTEGDCLSMVGARLIQPKHDYAVRLVRNWQRFVYGGEDVESSVVHALCHDFASALDRAA